MEKFRILLSVINDCAIQRNGATESQLKIISQYLHSAILEHEKKQLIELARIQRVNRSRIDRLFAESLSEKDVNYDNTIADYVDDAYDKVLDAVEGLIIKLDKLQVSKRAGNGRKPSVLK